MAVLFARRLRRAGAAGSLYAAELLGREVVEHLDHLVHAGNARRDLRGVVAFFLRHPAEQINDAAFGRDLDDTEWNLLRLDECGAHLAGNRDVVVAHRGRRKLAHLQLVHHLAHAFALARDLLDLLVDALADHLSRQEHLAVVAGDVHADLAILVVAVDSAIQASLDRLVLELNSGRAAIRRKYRSAADRSATDDQRYTCPAKQARRKQHADQHQRTIVRSHIPPCSDSRTTYLLIGKRILDPVADTATIGSDHVEAAWRHAARALVCSAKMLRQVMLRRAYEALAFEPVNASGCTAKCIAAAKPYFYEHNGSPVLCYYVELALAITNVA